MYHLFNAVYVESEWRINRHSDYITISPQVGYEYVPVKHEDLGDHFGFAQSLDDLTPETFRDLFMKAYRNADRTMVFVDGKTYVRLYALLVKALLPTIDLETFQWIMVCKKATFNVSMTNTQKPTNDFVDEVVINRATVQHYFETEDPLLPAMKELLEIDPEAISLEWRILRLKVDNIVGNIPETLNKLLRRIALANTYDALDVWGRYMTDPEHWEFAGCTLETLLDAPTAFQGALNMLYTSNPIFLKPGVFKTAYDDDWIVGLLDELIPMLERCAEGPTHDRTVIIRDLMTRNENLQDPKVCMSWVMTMFHGNKRLAMPNYDTGKYDENLIRFILSTPVEQLARCLQGVQW